MGVEIIPKHSLSLLKPEQSGLPERPLGQILEEDKKVEKYGHLLEAGIAGERESKRWAEEERSKLRFRPMLSLEEEKAHR